MKRIGDFLTRYLWAILLATCLISFFFSETVSVIRVSWVNPLLMVAMFGMGLTIKFRDFRHVFTAPRDILIGTVAQFTVMPLVAWGLCHVFGLDPAVAVGVVLVGTCPGGTASNVIAYLAKGDVAYSVSMTSVNTVLSPFLTPFLTWLLIGADVNVDHWVLCRAIVEVIALPIVLGFLVQRFFPAVVGKCAGLLPVVSVAAVLLIDASVVSNNAERIVLSGFLLISVVACHNLAGCAAGYLVGKAFSMRPDRRNALVIEVGMQNSALASALAVTAFPLYPMAAVPGAVFSVWHLLTGAFLAALMRRASS